MIGTSSKLFIVSGPSGVGKDAVVTLVKEKAIEGGLSLKVPKSYTTRPPRDSENASSNYRFVSEREFDCLLNEDLIEHTESHGHRYGSCRKDYDEILLNGHSMLKILDCNGAMSIKKQYPENTTLIFLSPPSVEVLRERLSNRNSESEESFNQRMEDSKKEMLLSENFDEIVVNETLEQTANAVLKIVSQH